MSSRTDKASRRAGYVYAIHEVGSYRYKIGHGINPSRRIKQLQTGNGTKLIIYATRHFDDRIAAEGRIHDIFDAYKERKGGGEEWFVLDRQAKHMLDIIFKKEIASEYEKQQLSRLQLL
jgi:hypothetical protein